MSLPLYYCGPRVSVGDTVSVFVDVSSYEGEIISIDWFARLVVVRYADWQDQAPDGSPTQKSRVFPIEDVRLIARAS